MQPTQNNFSALSQNRPPPQPAAPQVSIKIASTLYLTFYITFNYSTDKMVLVLLTTKCQR